LPRTSLRRTARRPASPGSETTAVFLHDKESDGAIDMGDPIAVLLDPEEALQELGDGAAVVLSDVTIDFFRSRAGAESMDVRNSSVADVTATADASPQTE
jgi:hypothetical protein